MITNIPQSDPVSSTFVHNSAHVRTLISARALPRALRPYRQFVAWRYAANGDKKPIKVPVNCYTLGNAGSTWGNTWTTLLHAVDTYQAHEHLNGIGFVVSQNDPYTMIDLDGCMHAGEPNTFACDVLNRLQTYAELSPSGKGLRLFVRNESQPPVLKRPQIEIYSNERFATLTGNVLDDRPIATADLGWLYAMFPKVEAPAPHNHSSIPSEPIPIDDAALWDRIFHLDQFGADHKRRFDGNLTGDSDPKTGLPDDTLAIIRLLNCLARWTGSDHARMARMIRQTHLDQSWWDDKRGNTTWLDSQILDAIDYVNGRKHSKWIRG